MDHVTTADNQRTMLIIVIVVMSSTRDVIILRATDKSHKPEYRPIPTVCGALKVKVVNEMR